jgi:hypothetical protein
MGRMARERREWPSVIVEVTYNCEDEYVDKTVEIKHSSSVTLKFPAA